MSDDILSKQQDYLGWLSAVKSRYQQKQIKAAVQVNRALLEFYWNLGRDIVERDWENVYGSGFFKKLSNDLKAELNNPKGFSENNLRYMRSFYRLYAPLLQKLQQPVGESDLRKNKEASSPEILFSIPWGHHVQIINKRGSHLDKAIFYAKKCQEYNWSRSVLLNFLDTDLYELYSPVFSNYSLPTEELQNLPQLVGKLQTALTEQDRQSLFHTPWGHHKLKKSKDNVLAKYSLEASNVPMGISEYELAKLYPVDLKSTLPSIEEIEREIDSKGAEK